jgi:hypothetical protein
MRRNSSLFAGFIGMEKNRRTRGPIDYVEFAYKRKNVYEINCNTNRCDGERNSDKREP